MTEQTVLLVEDNDDDADLTMRAFRAAHATSRIERARDGVEALDVLFRRGAHARRTGEALPAVILLDLKLPRLDGLGVLEAIRADARTSHLPVVVLTSSTEEADRLAVYEQQANSYVRKPVDYDEFVTAAYELGRYWTTVNVPAPALHHLTKARP
jgi:two-component system, response regulator